ncbi:hypothetical protein F383_32450 [Gossypium arboreum]|uniref:Uncharacterized protein n=1 Tax=Gossypium arboreum TaxID=29729 RepID=A0A0B0PRA0_GOSAR|nr:hypothetical protein F383_32450 [Gossypium arboreum]
MYGTKCASLNHMALSVRDQLLSTMCANSVHNRDRVFTW